MKEQITRKVEFYADGKKITAEADLKTARAIDVYKIVYNKIKNFDIKARTIPGTHDGWMREIIFAKSHKIKIVCTKEFMPDVPEIICNPRYTCGIANANNNKFVPVPGGVSVLYYELFNGRIK